MSVPYPEVLEGVKSGKSRRWENMIIRKGRLYFLTVGELKAERRVTAGRQLEISEKGKIC